MRRIILGLCFFVLLFGIIPLPSFRLAENLSEFFNLSFVFADSAPISQNEIKELQEFFDNYVSEANSYDESFADNYTNDALIKRIVIKDTGEKQTVVIPTERYFSELKKGKTLAKLVRYKNSYSNKIYEKLSDGVFKIKAIRTPMRDKRGLGAYFVVKKTPHGLKISEESMETTVTRFLDEK